MVEGMMTVLIKSLEFSQAEVMDLKNNSKVFQKSNIDEQVVVEGLQSRIAQLE